MSKRAKSGDTVNTPLGKRRLDTEGSAIGAARMNPADAYGAVPLLLKEYLDKGSESAWRDIGRRIDNIYTAVSAAIDALEAEVSFSSEIKKRINAGQYLFFKPNLVSLPQIEYHTHGPGRVGANVSWEFVAAVMRWFHDRLDISYHQMSLGEAATATPTETGKVKKLFRDNAFTSKALMEGKWGNNYGGWGFYFVRKYLAERHDPSHTDDPRRGYEESCSEVCLPPGRARDKLLVYDINKVDETTGRDIPVQDGINYRNITLHKVIVGGVPGDAQDCRDWPGCIIINIAKLKIHAAELITSAIKNLGIGLYSMEANASKEPGKFRWKYAVPPRPMPSFKMALPHAPWVTEVDEETGMPLRDKDGNYVMRKTGGMEATMADVLQAVKSQDIKIFNVVDAIEATNVFHSDFGCVPVPEGFVFTSTDMVAVDVLGARYLFSMVPMSEAEIVKKEYKLTSDVIQKVPLPRVEGRNIVTGQGFDSAFSRYTTFQHCVDRGLGQQRFYVVGKDLWQGGSLASVNQRFGRVEGSVFTELLTGTMYHAMMKPLWDLQATCLAYLEANDRLTGSDFKRQVLAEYDENGDGVIDYREKGKGGSMTVMAYGMRLNALDMDPVKTLKYRFLITTTSLRLLRGQWNRDWYDIGERGLITTALVKAIEMSRAPQESPDPLFPGMTWGKGKWPSLQFALNQQIYARIYGQMYPGRFDLLMAPYGHALRYADARWNGAEYCTAQAVARNEDVIGKYHNAVAGGAKLLPFVFYVPRGYAGSGKLPIANVQETEDAGLMFSASFDNGTEVWRDLRLSEVP